MTEPTTSQLSPNKQALLKIRQLKQQLKEAQRFPGGPIAIVSMACRFPRSSRTPESFWQCLMDGTDEVSEIPVDRWDLDAFYDEDPEIPGKMYARRGVFLEDLDLMDAEFFGISPREATWVDPQQRLLMEVGWEALERAAWTPEQIGEHTGVFVGWMHNDYQNEASDSFLNLNPYIATGAAGSFLCGRLAYYLGLQGPSVAVDTACSSSLVALHLACQSLQRGDCDRALVGGVNAIVSPTTNILTCKLKALSPRGHSRAFDAAADGYLRGEGCGVVTLRRLEDAEREGDPILGIIRGSSVGHNGFSSGLTAPNPRAQEKVIREALERADLDPTDIGYLEAHGTGTELGDPIEMQAAAAVLTRNRPADTPLLVGSVKTNIGHLEAAAGMAGLIKVLLAMQHGVVPAQLNFEEPNPHIPWDAMPVKVVTTPTPWPPARGRCCAGVSAFGMSGTNAHVVVESPTTAPTRPTAQIGRQAERETPQLVVLSGKSEQAIPDLAERLAKQLQCDSGMSLGDVAFTTGIGRTHLEHRAAIVAADREAAIERLNALTRGGQTDAAFRGNSRKAPKVAWQFTGQGAQYVGMARGLYEAESVFRAAIDQCDEFLHERRDESLVDALFNHRDALDHTSWTQPATFALQMGIARLLESWGLRPDMVLGHSVGQFAAACVAGIMSWEGGLRLINERARLIGRLPSGGKMLAVFAAMAPVQEVIKAVPSVSIAALNGTHIVVSGPDTDIDAVAAAFTSRSFRVRPLATSHAFHSSLMDEAVQPFQDFADNVAYQTGHIPLVCNISGRVLRTDESLNGAYWARHIREPVRYAEGVAAVQDAGCELLIELGPQAVLTQMATGTWRGAPERLFSCLRKGDDDQESILRAVAQLYVHGVTPDFDSIHRGRGHRAVLLPTYPFQRRRFWGPDKPRAAHAEFHTAHPLLGPPVKLAGANGESRFESFVDEDSPPWLRDHRVMDQVVVPGAAYVEMALAAAGVGEIRNLVFEQPLQPKSRTALQTVVRTGDDDKKTIEIYSAAAGTNSWTRHCNAVCAASSAVPLPVDRTEWTASCTETVAPTELYQKLSELGLEYGPEFQTVKSIRYSQDQVLVQLQTNSDLRGFALAPTLIDGALHSLAVGLLREDSEDLFLPVGIGRVAYFQETERELWCHARWKDRESRTPTADLVLFTESGDVVALLEDLRVQRTSRAALRKLDGAGPTRLLYEVQWNDFRLSAQTASGSRWLIVNPGESESTFCQNLAAALEQSGHEAIELTLRPDSATTEVGEATRRIPGKTPEQWEGLFGQLFADGLPDGIVWLLADGPLDPQDVIPSRDSTETNCEGLLSLIAAARTRGAGGLTCGLQLVTTDAVAHQGLAAVDVNQAQYWGLGRVVGAEAPEMRCRLIDISAGEKEAATTAASVADVLVTETRDNQLAIRGQRLFVPRLKKLSPAKQSNLQVHKAGSYLVTGGLGMLGRRAAEWLARKGAGEIVLLSRRAPDAQASEFIKEIEESGCRVIVHPADISSAADVGELFARFGTELRPLRGVIHAAGVLDDGLLTDQNWDRFRKVLAPKVVGAALLHEQTAELQLDFFVLYSSVAAILGSPGQSNYATANAYLDGLAWHRRGLGLPAVSVNWGPWNVGMADDERIAKRLSLQGITPLTVEESHLALERVLESGVTQATVFDVDWRRMRMSLGGEPPALLGSVAPTRAKAQVGDSELVSKLKQLGGPARKQLLIETMQSVLREVLSSSETPETDRPLIEMGLDSLMAVEFGTGLQQLLGDGFAVGPTMLFDHPTIDAIADHVLTQLGGGESAEVVNSEAAPSIPPSPQPTTPREDIAIIGMSCRFPGARNTEEFWQNLIGGVDSVGEIPEDRWDVERFFSPTPEPGKMHSREGGFLNDVGGFDAAFFNISEAEACWIDPQHRLLLENSYHALEDAGIPANPLRDSNVGVFMGIMGQDYAFLPSLEDVEVIRGFQGAGLSHSAGVGRISYIFGFEGPSIAVDTASSSSLVAVLQAARSLQDGNCNLALAGGVNAILAPVNSLLMAKAGLLAPDGRCKSFSAQANGFGRGEGCGVVVLKRLSDAERDGDRVLAVVCGGAIVHNGFSGGITSPSGRAQSRVIAEALSDAGLSPAQVQYLEAHGTGTEYGDPMELAAAASVYGKGRDSEDTLLVGSVKSNISHLEAAGGISGLIKTVLAMQCGVIPKQLHFEEPNPHVPWERLPLKIVTEETPWPDCERRYAGVTALGLVGTNAHLILGSPIDQRPTASVGTTDNTGGEENDPHPHMLALSARSEAALEKLASALREFLSSNPNVDVANVCHTLGLGRRHYEHRLAFTVHTVEDAVRGLWACTKGNGTPLGLSDGKGHLHTENGKSECRSTSRGIVHGPTGSAWLFGGEDMNALQAAANLQRVEPAFRKSLSDFEAHLEEHFESDNQLVGRFRDWRNSGSDPGGVEELCLFAVQSGLVTLLRSWGLEPDAVLGLGVGQYTASCVAGGLSFTDALLLVAKRTPIAAEVVELAGASAKSEPLPAEWEGLLDDFESFADRFNYYPPNLPLVCSLDGGLVPVHRSLGGSYWRRHCVEPPAPIDALSALAAQGCDCVIELTSAPSAEAMNHSTEVGKDIQRIAALTTDLAPAESLLDALGRLYVAGVNPDFQAFAKSRQGTRISLPKYPFEKKKYWITDIAEYTDPVSQSLEAQS